MSKLRILVVGASVAGPTAAYWLAKAGVDVTVIERFPELRTSGQGIDIRTVGVTVMRRTPGMEAAVRAKFTGMEGMSFVREDGRPYGTLTATGDPDQQSLVSEYEIFRGDLARILYDITKDNDSIRYIFGEQVASIQQGENQDGPVTVEFANGSPTSEYDLVVACDGATSRTRAMGLGCGVRDHIRSSNAWATYFSIRQDLLQGSKIAQAVTAVGGRFVGVGPDPSGVNRVALMRFHPSDGTDTATLPFREALKKGDQALKEFVTQQFKGMGWKTEEILKAMMESDDFYGSEVVHVKSPVICQGRFVMVGDAGYAPGLTGGGTSLALAGAYILAGEICRQRKDLAAALQNYQERMKPIIEDLQQVPPLVTTIMAPQTAWGIWVRNHIFATVSTIWVFISWTGIPQLMQRCFAGAFASPDKHKLPHYEWIA